ncbi:site-specific tyrosine recombinase XerD [Corynebacterium uterequi]|uniref:Tyrosine recombinase XerD n=1 Tax=Corynebacterium uterequi TaxID=1072256 RepID=A0A0G3HCJ9_9CORY|nr:site-specific tyrosine recombinase XerD [Corynebacterium uterequi]AKK11039.1 tyrosine recombinase XerD subunit [Corynebacterium uterequi]
MAVAISDLARSWISHLAVERGVSQNTLSNYRRDVRRYLSWLNEVNITDLTQVKASDLEAYVQDLRTGRFGPSPLAASSAARALVVARGLHRFALDEGVIDVDVAADVAPPAGGQHLPDTLSIDEVAALLDAIPTGETATPTDLRDRAVLELLYGTGARVSEVLALTMDHTASLSEGMVTLDGKGGKQRLVPVGSAARDAVEAYLVRARPVLSRGKTHALFLNKRGGHLSRQSTWAIIKTAAERAGIDKDISPHTLRHSYGTHLLEGGADVRTVQELLGHASVTTTQIYTHITADNLRQVWHEAHPRA